MKTITLALILLLITYKELTAQYQIDYDEQKRLRAEEIQQEYENSKRRNNSIETQSFASSMSPSSSSPVSCERPYAPSSINCSIQNPAFDSSFTKLIPINGVDDGYSSEIPLGFNFNLYGDTYNSVFVNINGNITCINPYHEFRTEGFPLDTLPMLAPFWADVDLGGTGEIYYKKEVNRFTVIWYQVGYYNDKIDKVNTFKLIITDGNDPSIGIGNNVAFMYGDMQWTEGDYYSTTDNGFGDNPATVGVNKGTGQNGCFFMQIGRFGKPGSEDAGCDGTSGIDFLDNKCFAFDVSQFQNVEAGFSYQKSLCATLFNAEINNPNGCSIGSISWDFGDGSTSTELNPLHTYENPGSYEAELIVDYSCGACGLSSDTIQQTVIVNELYEYFKDTTITVPTSSINQTLSSSSATFSDTWPLAHPDESIAERHGYANGTQGVWRSEGSWVYDVERAASENVDVSKDGVFTLERFNHQYADLEAIPHWMKVNTVTTYSPYSYELENQDILGRYTSALYSYGGQLPQATGANMRQQEMAFTSFEYLEGSTDGNWILGSQAQPAYQRYKVQAARGRLAQVEASLEELQNVTDVDVHSYKLFSPSRRVQQNTILCRYEHEDNPDWSVVVFERPVVETLWRGAVVVRGTHAPAVNITLDTTWAHAGQKSMKVSSNITLKQPILQLDSGKQYLLSAWVSEKNLQAMTPELSPGIGIDVVFKNENDVEIARTSMTPNGSIIEGWQRLEGRFTCPGQSASMELDFKNGSAANAWFDDLKLHPVEGNMQAYVYNLKDYRLQAVLDENHYASFYFYDAEGNLYLTKKETLDGIKTISETISHTVEASNP